MAPRPCLICISLLALLSVLHAPSAGAMPAFARTYDISCNTCHSAFPRLSPMGEMFADEWNFRLPNWKQQSLNLEDDRLYLPEQLPLGLRAQGFVQARDGEAIDPVTGDVVADSSVDFQSPYLVKLLASAPLSEQISFYFYTIFAEKGSNGRYSFGTTDYRVIEEKDVMSGEIATVDDGVYHERLLDILDVDNDGVAEVFTYVQSFEGAGFNAYRRADGKWTKIYDGANYHCGY